MVEWDKIQEERARAAAREEATQIVEGVLNRLHDKLVTLYHAEVNEVRAGLLYGIMGAVQDTIREVNTYATEPHKPVSRPVRSTPDPVDHYPLACGDSSCTRTHGTSGGHTS
jgi:hypothetical protein